MSSKDAVISALAYSFIRERFPRLDVSAEFPQNRAARFVVEQQGRMSAHLRVPLVILTLGFDAAGVLSGGRRFRAKGHGARWKQIEAWRSSRIGLRRDFIRFYESLVVFGCGSMIRFDAGDGGRRPAAVGASKAVEAA